MNILSDLAALRKLPYNKIALKGMIIDIIENVLFSMFEYKNFPESMPSKYAERYFIYQGACGAYKLKDNELKYNQGQTPGASVFLSAQPAEDPDIYGIGSKVIITSANGFNKTTTYDEVALGYNNSAHTNMRPFIMMVADAITEALSAVRVGVIYTKNHPIYKAADDKEKMALEEHWKAVRDDNLKDLAITSPNILRDELLGNSNTPASNVINLTDPTKSDKIQYLLAVVNEYIRWAFSLMGQDIQGGDGKMAQQSVEEVTGRTSTSFILPNDMLAQRLVWLDKMKALGIVPEDAEIDFSTAWKVEQIKYTKEADIDENGEIEELSDNSSDETMDQDESSDNLEEEKEEEKDEEGV